VQLAITALLEQRLPLSLPVRMELIQIAQTFLLHPNVRIVLLAAIVPVE